MLYVKHFKTTKQFWSGSMWGFKCQYAWGVERYPDWPPLSFVHWKGHYKLEFAVEIDTPMSACFTIISNFIIADAHYISHGCVLWSSIFSCKFKKGQSFIKIKQWVFFIIMLKILMIPRRALLPISTSGLVTLSDSSLFLVIFVFQKKINKPAHKLLDYLGNSLCQPKKSLKSSDLVFTGCQSWVLGMAKCFCSWEKVKLFGDWELDTPVTVFWFWKNF